MIVLRAGNWGRVDEGLGGSPAGAGLGDLPTEFGSLTKAKFVQLTRYAATALPLASFHIGEKETQMKRIKPTAKLAKWVKVCWLLVSNRSFRAARDKRRAYYEYRLGKGYNTPCC